MIRRGVTPSFVPPGWAGDRYVRLARKLKRLDISTMLDFADVSGSAMALAFGDYRRHGELASLDEIQEGLMTLWGVAEELRERKQSEVKLGVDGK